MSFLSLEKKQDSGRECKALFIMCQYRQRYHFEREARRIWAQCKCGILT